MRRLTSDKPSSARRRTLSRLFLLSLSVFLPGLAFAAADFAKTPHVEARLVFENRNLVPGAENWVGLQLKIIPHWHVYWRNPGDSGLATTLKWQLPEGVTAGEILWPLPSRFPVPPLVNYGYEKEVLLPVQLTVAPSVAAGSEAVVRVRADWLVCAEICVPESADFVKRIRIATGPPNPDPSAAPKFAAARLALPQPTTGDFRALVRAKEIALVLRGQPFSGLKSAPELFPISEGIVKNAVAPIATRLRDGWEVVFAKDENFSDAAKEFAALAVAREPNAPPLGFEIRATIGPASNWLWVLNMAALAFLGGALLNLMPCVFPVLALKVLGFVRHGQESRTVVLTHAAVYALGVVSSFLVMALALLAFRAAGEELGWGFQLQSPTFLFLLTALMFLMGLNLAGYFELTGRFANFGDQLTRGGGKAADFFTGALAVVVATPCTAPFMGTAVGAAFTQPPAIMLVIFASLGLGMAAPYVTLAALPGLARSLPKPGPWMVTLKEFLAFPLFATCVWLLWVLSLQTGSEGVAGALLGLLTLVLAIWLAKRLHSPALKTLSVVACFALALYLGCGFASRLESPADSGTATSEGWAPFSEAAVAEAVASGKPVFVNFTAAWCITCNVNERLVFRDRKVREEFTKRGVALFKADWTNRDDTIGRALAAHGRAGVPLYLLYRPGQAQPEILPQILTSASFLEALSR